MRLAGIFMDRFALLIGLIESTWGITRGYRRGQFRPHSKISNMENYQ